MKAKIRNPKVFLFLMSEVCQNTVSEHHSAVLSTLYSKDIWEYTYVRRSLNEWTVFLILGLNSAPNVKKQERNWLSGQNLNLFINFQFL